MSAMALAANVPFTAAAAARRQPAQQRRAALRVAAGGGFGSKQQGGAPSSSSKKQPKLARYLERDPAPASSGDAVEDGWVEMPAVDYETTFLSKPIKPLILATGRAVCLFKVEDRVYATDANSTAYKYPLADATLLRVKGKPAVESPLDGTVYDLDSGKVLSWCPKNSMVRKVLGSLKDKSNPVDLPVYPVQIRGNKVYVKFI